MTITRAKKAPAKASKVDRPELTPEEFIAAAEKPALPPPPKKSAATIEHEPELDRIASAERLVRSYVPWSAGAGVLPFPGLDLAAIAGVQLRMLAKLSESYGVPFREEAGRSVIATLMSAGVQYGLSGHVAWAMKAVPVAGTLLGMAVLPAFAAATTLALGRVFITHFESGGTFLDFDPRKVEAHFHAEFERAKGNLSGKPAAA